MLLLTFVKRQQLGNDDEADRLARIETHRQVISCVRSLGAESQKINFYCPSFVHNLSHKSIAWLLCDVKELCLSVQSHFLLIDRQNHALNVQNSFANSLGQPLLLAESMLSHNVISISLQTLLLFLASLPMGGLRCILSNDRKTASRLWI